MMRSARGFTLIELLMVIAVIGILAAILLPSLALSREHSRRASCLMNLSQIGLAMHMYADEYDRQLPWSGGNDNGDCLASFVVREIPTYKLFICPSDPTTGLRVREGDDVLAHTPLGGRLGGPNSLRQSYDYLGAYTASAIVMPKPWEPVQRIPVMWDIAGTNSEEFNHEPVGSNVLWLDGSVEFMHIDQFVSPFLPFRPAGLVFQEPAGIVRTAL